jgi:hypothetical protein
MGDILWLGVDMPCLFPCWFRDNGIGYAAHNPFIPPGLTAWAQTYTLKSVANIKINPAIIHENHLYPRF